MPRDDEFASCAGCGNAVTYKDAHLCDACGYYFCGECYEEPEMHECAA